ncbi:hypothetical protein PPL_01373 [Heterostelium album PN500]|uniref:Uncharacterized protein n=1 Tax=Heterostelium pallidum (strain ATCC 26659 / Pp 5 / PN500) TaxID=670386 RepID=D3AZ33_HETP5|nr:hypothetical protein PPL_01373 [Heterostelium album PN500]EFA85590.1 hypothetical protein PPL_01373 [Heterostelium album PN500]|eukprot:XP_020437697.1 hypothetical protein PPL_01373 [Heterostelium album PN500]
MFKKYGFSFYCVYIVGFPSSFDFSKIACSNWCHTTPKIKLPSQVSPHPVNSLESVATKSVPFILITYIFEYILLLLYYDCTQLKPTQPHITTMMQYIHPRRGYLEEVEQQDELEEEHQLDTTL